MMKSSPLVSIITGYYNRKEKLQESVQSVLNQTYDNFEFIIFDDCSNDGTYEMISQFQDPRLKVIRHAVNIGFTKGIISAIAQSRGEFIAIHGAGDISYPERIQKQVNLLVNKPNVGMVGCLLKDIKGDKITEFSPRRAKSQELHFTQGEVMFRRELYFRIGGYNPLFKYGQFTIMKQAMHKIADEDFVEEVLYERIHHANGVTKNPAKIFEQKIYMGLGRDINYAGSLLKIDLSRAVINAGLLHSEYVDNDEKREILEFHIKKKGGLIRMLYTLSRSSVLPSKLLKRIILKLVN